MSAQTVVETAVGTNNYRRQGGGKKREFDIHPRVVNLQLYSHGCAYSWTVSLVPIKEKHQFVATAISAFNSSLILTIYSLFCWFLLGLITFLLLFSR